MRYPFLVLATFVAGCCSLLAPTVVPPSPRPAPYLDGGTFERSVVNGLTSSERREYYSLDEGIHWVPVDIALALKRPADGLAVYDEALFARPEIMGLYPNVVDPTSELPLGLTVSADAVPMLGINCATCHTGLIANDSGSYALIDGGSGQFAIDRFVENLVKAMVNTMINPSEFEAFYQRFRVRADRRGSLAGHSLEEDSLDVDLSETLQEILETGDTAELHDLLDSDPDLVAATTFGEGPTPGELSTRTKVYLYLARRFLFLFEQAQYGAPSGNVQVTPSGFGRSNPWAVTKRMFGDHLDRIQDARAIPKVEGGPINTPHIWDYDRQKWVFWTGVTNSMVERNMAQGVALLTDFDWDTWSTTIRIKKLEAVSSFARKAKAPSWPSFLGPVDLVAASQGKDIFVKKCLNCHDPKLEATTTASAEFNYIDVGTDPAYYLGQVEPLGRYDLFTEVLAPMMGKVKAQSALTEGVDVTWFEVGRLPVVWRRPTANRIAAKPLAGIWATAPYLHNGSVPSIAALLSPAHARPKKFYVGGVVYDPEVLGFKQDPNRFLFNTTLPGNSNGGHEFVLTEDERLLMIEFLKVYDAETVF